MPGSLPLLPPRGKSLLHRCLLGGLAALLPWAALASSDVPAFSVPDEPLDSDARPAQVAAAADGATTWLALGTGGTEINGLMPVTPVGIVGVTVLKVGLATQLAKLPESHRELGLKTTTAAWGGAAVNNLLAWVAAAPPVALGTGLLTAWVLWQRTGEQLHTQRMARAHNAALALQAFMPLQGQLSTTTQDTATLSPTGPA